MVTEDEDLYKRCAALHDLGYARNSEGRLDPTDERYQYWGTGSRMSELAGAMALGQMRKVKAITGRMREAKWRIREAIKDIPGIGLRDISDPSGDTGPVLITIYETAAACQRFVDALRAEGIRGPEGSLACITMREWGMHWYFNIPSLVKKRSNARDGFPWTQPSNAFASSYSYERGLLPVCDSLSERAALLTVMPVLTDKDVDDIIAAFRKVGNAFAPQTKAAE